MESQITESFYVSKKGSYRVEEIRTKFYIMDKVKFLIQKAGRNQEGQRYRYVTEEEFYLIPETHESIKFE